MTVDHGPTPVPAPAPPTITRHPSLTVPGISSSTRVRAGDLVFLSGQTASLPVPDSFRDELASAFSALGAALSQAGASRENLARITLYVVDLPSRSLDDIREVRDAWLVEDCLPASSFVGVAALALPGLRAEIEAVAVV
ncbi:RidA family protein [Sanguibacter sp. 4.1]|uniref:RidA family protein n=1 Tax=Sanguibacter biliveldensis TaxID=3030830 RepID=A0AAF0Z8I2_9MICO|nr:RidA family protein [Sanguibacter sp. 4.1]WPF82446.1 RidA family protein [Sanguibacter sp. 4.1]